MTWLLENLLPVFLLGCFLLLASFVRLQFEKPVLWLLIPGGVMLLAVLVASAYVAFFSTPDDGELVDVEPDDPSEVEVTPVIARLKDSWDSEKREADWPVAETLAVLSKTAYLPPYDADAEYKRLGFQKVVPIVSQSMIGYIVMNEDSTVICFRGTDFTELADWIANLDRSSTEVRHGKIHRGFYHAYLSLKPQIEAVLADHPTEHLWITGHSLGGALALICGYDFMEYEQRDFDGIMTFGQPKVARQNLAEHLDTKLVGKYARVVNGEDLVARIPPSHVFCGSLVWFTEGQLKRSQPKTMTTDSGDGRLAIPALDEGAELPELSEEEFDQLQQDLQVEAPDRELPSTTPPTAPQMPASEFPLGTRTRIIEDHSMMLYIEKIRDHLGFTDSP